MTIVKLDGIPIEVIPPDLDKDGKVGGVEKVTQRTAHDENVIPIKQSSELGDSLDIAFSDKFNPVDLVSDVDLKANLHPAQIPFLSIFDSLCKMKFISVNNLAISRQIKRLSVSEKTKHMGVGRKNIVDMVTGKREHDKLAGDKAQTFSIGEIKK